MYYFDALPVHFPPKQFETLTSYLSRLVRENGISSKKDLTFFLLNDPELRYYFRKAADLPPVFVDLLAAVTAQTNDTILQTTLYPAAVNLGRTSQPQSLSRFLKGSIGDGLRFCPSCLREDRYYQLPWRFLLLKVCPVHGCNLIEACLDCGAKIPLLSENLLVGWCPSCGQDLAAVPITCQESSEHLIAQVGAYRILTSLLKLKQEQVGRYQKRLNIGKMLTRVRKARNLTLAAAARETNLEAHILKKLETGSQEEGAGTLNDLIQYTEFLGVSLKSCIEVASSPQDWVSVEVKKQEPEVIMRKRKPIIRSVDRVDDLAEKILAKVNEFKQSGKPITREAITRAMGLKSIHPHGKPDVVQALREIRQAHQEQVWGANREKEGEMLHRVEQMIPLVIQQKGHLEITALCRLAGIDRNLIRRSLPLRRVLARFAEKSKPCLEEMVQQAIWDLQLKNRRLTQTAIARKVGYSARGLLKNPKVYSIFVQYGLVKVSTKEEVAIKSDGIVYNGSSFYG